MHKCHQRCTSAQLSPIVSPLITNYQVSGATRMTTMTMMSTLTLPWTLVGWLLIGWWQILANIKHYLTLDSWFVSPDAWISHSDDFNHSRYWALTWPWLVGWSAIGFRIQKILSFKKQFFATQATVWSIPTSLYVCKVFLTKSKQGKIINQGVNDRLQRRCVS